LINSNYKIYPNPNFGQLIIELENDSRQVEIEVTDVRGVRVFYQAAQQLAFKTINTSSWPSGTYFVKLKDASQSVVQKIVKM